MPAHTDQESLFNKVANLSIFFWIIKIISTTTGEASADFLGGKFGASAGAVAFILLVISIVYKSSLNDIYLGCIGRLLY